MVPICVILIDIESMSIPFRSLVTWLEFFLLFMNWFMLLLKCYNFEALSGTKSIWVLFLYLSVINYKFFSWSCPCYLCFYYIYLWKKCMHGAKSTCMQYSPLVCFPSLLTETCISIWRGSKESCNGVWPWYFILYKPTQDILPLKKPRQNKLASLCAAVLAAR